jgi:hypothetical protein
MISVKGGFGEIRPAHFSTGFRLLSGDRPRMAAVTFGAEHGGASKIDLSQNSALHKGLEED